MALRLVEPPTQEPVQVEECRFRLRIDSEEEDSVLASMLKAARQEIDGANGWLGRALLTQTWELTLVQFPHHGVDLPLPPLQSIVSVSYMDGSGAARLLASTSYSVLHRGDWPSRLLLEPGFAWPWAATGAAAFTVRFVAGWASPDDVPETIRTWMIARVGGWYAQREDVVVGVASAPAVNYHDMLAHLRVGWVG